MYKLDLLVGWWSSSQHCPLWPHFLFLSFCAPQHATDYLSPCGEKEEVSSRSPQNLHQDVETEYHCTSVPILFAFVRFFIGNAKNLSNLPIITQLGNVNFFFFYCNYLKGLNSLLEADRSSNSGHSSSASRNSSSKSFSASSSPPAVDSNRVSVSISVSSSCLASSGTSA